MSTRNFSSVAVATTLSGAINASATSLTVAAVTGWPSAPFLIRVDENTASEEVMLVTAVAGTTLTVTRGYDSTVGVSHSSGAAVAHCVSAIDFREANAHVNATTGVHGITGAVVGTSDTQTLSNKTLTTPAITDLSNATHDHLSTAKGGLLPGYLRSDGSTLTTLASAATTFTIKAAATPSSPIFLIQDSTTATLLNVSTTGVLNTLKAFVSTAGTASAVPVTAKGAASQTANLQEWQSSASAVLASVDKNGKGTFTGLSSSAAGTFSDTTITASGAAAKGLVVKAGSATPTAHPVSFTDSSNAEQAYLDYNSGFWTWTAAGIKSSSWGISANGPSTYQPAFAGTEVPMTIKGFASQSANLLEFKNSAGTLLSNIDASGNLFLGGVQQKRIASGTTSVTFSAGAGTLTYGSLGFTPSRLIVTSGMGASPVVVGVSGVPGATSVTLAAWAGTSLTAYTGNLISVHWIAVE